MVGCSLLQPILRGECLVVCHFWCTRDGGCSWIVIVIRDVNRVAELPRLPCCASFLSAPRPPPPFPNPSQMHRARCPSCRTRLSGGVSRWASRFAQYDGRIVKVALHAMPVMLLCHCLFALFTFSGGTFFESEYLADALSSRVDVRQERSKGTRKSTGVSGTKRGIERERGDRREKEGRAKAGSEVFGWRRRRGYQENAKMKNRGRVVSSSPQPGVSEPRDLKTRILLLRLRPAAAVDTRPVRCTRACVPFKKNHFFPINRARPPPK